MDFKDINEPPTMTRPNPEPPDAAQTAKAFTELRKVYQPRALGRVIAATALAFWALPVFFVAIQQLNLLYSTPDHDKGLQAVGIIMFAPIMTAVILFYSLLIPAMVAAVLAYFVVINLADRMARLQIAESRVDSAALVAFCKSYGLVYGVLAGMGVLIFMFSLLHK